MTAALVKILGTAHGLFALWTLLMLPAIFKSGILDKLSPIQVMIKLTASFLGIALLFLCMWFSWQLSTNSFAYAWLALGTFLIAAFSDSVALYGPAALFRLMPAFYTAVAVRIVAAFALTALILNLPPHAVGG